MLQLLMIAVLGVHLLAVDLAMAGPLVAVAVQWRARRRQDSAAAALARRLAGWSIGAAALGIALGLAALVLVPHVEAEPYRRALALIPASRWWFVAGELVFYFVCMAAYVGPWRRMQRWPRWHGVIAILAGTDLMYHFPPLFAVISTLSLQPKMWDSPLDHRLYWTILLEGQTLAMVLHHWLAAVSVAAIAALLLCEKMGTGTSRPIDPPKLPAERSEPVPISSHEPTAELATAKWAARIALAATLLQLPVGIGLLLALPGALQNPLLGDDWVSTLLFGVSLVMALGLMHHLSVIALGDLRRGAVVRTAGLMIATILLMAATLQHARHRAERSIGTARNGTARNGIARNGIARNGIARNGIARNGIARNGTEAVPYSAVVMACCRERPPWRSAVGVAVMATSSQAVAVLRPLAPSP